MKKACLVAALVLVVLQPLAFFPGCGGGNRVSEEEMVANFTIDSILIPRESDSDFIVELRRKSTGVGDVDPNELAQRYWKWEGETLIEITAEEFRGLAAARVGGDPTKWAYSQHAVTVLDLDEDNGEAVVEIGSLYGPLTGSGTQYLLRKDGGEWEEVSEETVWVS
jgi:hypothetical protein